MKASKQFSIVLAAAVLAFGAVTVAPQQTLLMATNILIPNVHQYLLQQVMLIQPWVLQ